ncbi:hypothetical protein GUJ93_ZPchr0004g38664 [Zizania palustris]|uniref:Carboxypeptidase n=1 Tax=Zizania palustris TaxID=103762 RepID=A0A8J5VFV2_ZIZPA|nr:hypothetical protein GUJ93_ZPchr0004g38664 [Zizania palustris]
MSVPMALLLSLSLAMAFLAASAAAATGASWSTRPEDDLVNGLPGQPDVGFRHYAGYVGVGSGSSKALFYWFFEAEKEPEKKPLMLWLNGGPGCSSVAYGAAQELGPFLVRSYGENLSLNAYSWNKGHYVPQLAELIYDGNKGASRDRVINVKGFMIGNAVLNDETDQMGMVEYAWSHAIISDELYSAVRRECDSFKEEEDGGKPGKGCSPAVRAFLRAYDDIDIYSIYTPTCLSSSSNASAPRRPSSRLVAAPRLFSKQEAWRRMQRGPAGYDPCTEEYVGRYFNREDVQRALHANRTGLSYPYSPCSEVISKWSDSPATVLPILKKLMGAGLRIWVYSGDTDGRVPVTSTRYSLNAMRLRPRARTAGAGDGWGGWRAWYDRQQVGGWAVEYEEGLTLVTVRGAGHQVPLFAPRRSIAMLHHFLRGTSLPASRSRV